MKLDGQWHTEYAIRYTRDDGTTISDWTTHSEAKAEYETRCAQRDGMAAEVVTRQHFISKWQPHHKEQK